MLVYTYVLLYLAKVFENDGDVHVDDDEEADDEIGDKIRDGQTAMTTITVRSRLAGRRVAPRHTQPPNSPATSIGVTSHGALGHVPPPPGACVCKPIWQWL